MPGVIHPPGRIQTVLGFDIQMGTEEKILLQFFVHSIVSYVEDQHISKVE